MLKLFEPYVSLRAAKYVKETLASGQLAEGPRVKEFEELFAETFNKRNVVSVNSGTSALEIAYDLAGLGEGDEVISPVLTCTATNIPLLRRGVKIVWGDVHLKELTLEPADVRAKIGPSTKAIIFVHMGGNNHNLKEIRKIARQWHIPVIEDAAQALGSEYWGVSEHTAVSLQAIKNLTTGDGGIYLGKQYSKAKRLRWYGYDRDKKQARGDSQLTEAGYKFHMNDIAASIGLANLKDWDAITTHKQRINKVYEDAGFHTGAWLAWGFTDNYKKLKKTAEEEGFEIGQHHFRNDKYRVFGGKRPLTNMDYIEGKYFFMPSHMGVSIRDATHIADVCQKS